MRTYSLPPSVTRVIPPLSLLVLLGGLSSCVDRGVVESAPPTAASSIATTRPATNPSVSGDRILIEGGDDESGYIRPFRLDRYLVTVEQYERCVDADACKGIRLWRSEPQHAISEAAASDAEAYCRWAGGRLPTDREWDWAATGRGQDRRYPWGKERPTCARVHFQVCRADSPDRPGEHPNAASRDGVQDMVGYVRQWVSAAGGGYMERGSWYLEGRRHMNLARGKRRGVAVLPELPSVTNGIRCAADVE